MDKKQCLKCNKWYELKEFHKNKSRCKMCAAIAFKEWYEKNRKRLSEKPRKGEHRSLNGVKQKFCLTCKSYKSLSEYCKRKAAWDGLASRCRSCRSIVKKKQYEKTMSTEEGRKKERERCKEKARKRRENGKRNAYRRKRLKSDPKFAMKYRLRSRFRNALLRQNVKKTESIFELCGCSIEFLKRYLEKKFLRGMTWENRGSWHIDHIRPCCSFDLRDPKQQKKCFHYSNLQPLWAKDNMKKGKKWVSKNN